MRLWPDIQLRAGLGSNGPEEVRLWIKLHLKRGLMVGVEILLPRRYNVLLRRVGESKKVSCFFVGRRVEFKWFGGSGNKG